MEEKEGPRVLPWESFILISTREIDGMKVLTFYHQRHQKEYDIDRWTPYVHKYMQDIEEKSEFCVIIWTFSSDGTHEKTIAVIPKLISLPMMLVCFTDGCKLYSTLKETLCITYKPEGKFESRRLPIKLLGFLNEENLKKFSQLINIEVDRFLIYPVPDSDLWRATEHLRPGQTIIVNK